MRTARAAPPFRQSHAWAVHVQACAACYALGEKLQETASPPPLPSGRKGAIARHMLLELERRVSETVELVMGYIDTCH